MQKANFRTGLAAVKGSATAKSFPLGSWSSLSLLPGSWRLGLAPLRSVRAFAHRPRACSRQNNESRFLQHKSDQDVLLVATSQHSHLDQSRYLLARCLASFFLTFRA